AAAILCHGNSFWAAVVLAVWYAIDNGVLMWRRPHGYAYAAALLIALAPYLIVVGLNRHELAAQIASFAADRVPGWRPSFLLEQIRLEPARYRDWYFGLVTETVRNPVLRVFQAAIVIGFAYTLLAALTSRAGEERRRMAMALVWAAGAAAIFAAFINNKALVYMPHLLLGFSLVAGIVTARGAAVIAAMFGHPRYGANVVAFVLIVAHATASAAYYEKWYWLMRKSELLPYESTAKTIVNLVPPGAKYVCAAAQFWIPFAERTDVRFFSHAAPAPVGSAGRLWPEWASDGRPLFLILDERQWGPELVAPSGGHAWQDAWITFIERQCRLHSYAPGTAFGTLAAYECGRGAMPAERPVFIASDSATYLPGPPVLLEDAAAVAAWSRSTEPKFPGITRTVSLAAGQPYLLTARVRAAAHGFVYLRRVTPPAGTSLSRGASGGGARP